MLSFDRDFYLSQNPDVAAAGVDPEAHFRLYGYLEGRNPNPLFDISYYLEQNPDIAAAGINAFDHFNAFGLSEQRDPTPLFSFSYYLEQNPDVAAAGVNPFDHFMAFGLTEQRDPSAFFDVSYYLEQNPDVAAAGVNAFTHWLTSGVAELRDPNAYFDMSAYASADTGAAAALAAGNVAELLNQVQEDVVIPVAAAIAAGSSASSAISGVASGVGASTGSTTTTTTTTTSGGGSSGGGGGGGSSASSTLAVTVNPASTLTVSGTPLSAVSVDLTQAAAADVVDEGSSSVTMTETATYAQASVTTVDAGSMGSNKGITVTIQQSDAGDLTSFTAPSSGTATLKLADGGDYTGQAVTNFDRVALTGADAAVTFDDSDLDGETVQFITDNASDVVNVTMSQADAAGGSDMSGISESGAGSTVLKLQDTGDYSGSVGAGKFDQIDLQTAFDNVVSFASTDVTGETVQFVTDNVADVITITQAASTASDFSNVTETGGGSLVLGIAAGGGDFTSVQGVSNFYTVSLNSADAQVTLDGGEVSGGNISFDGDSATDDVLLNLAQADASGADFSNIAKNGGGQDLDLKFTQTGDYSGVVGLDSFDEVEVAGGGTVTVAHADVDGNAVTFNTATAGDIVNISATAAQANGATYAGLADNGGGELNLALTTTGTIAGIDDISVFGKLDVSSANGGAVIIGTDDLDSLTLGVVTNDATDRLIAEMTTANAANDLSGVTKSGGGVFDLRFSSAAGSDYTNVVAANIATVGRILLDAGNGDYVVDTPSVTGLTLAVATDSTSDRLIIEIDDDEAAVALDNLSISNLGGGAGSIALYLTSANDGSYDDVAGLTSADLANVSQILLDDSGATADPDSAATFASTQLTGLTLSFVTDHVNDAVSITQAAATASDFRNITETGAGSLDLTLSASGDFTSVQGLGNFATVTVSAADAQVTLAGAEADGATLDFVGDSATDDVLLTLAQADASGADFSGLTASGSTQDLDLKFTQTGDYSGITGLDSFDEVEVAGGGTVTVANADVHNKTVTFNTATGADIVSLSVTAAQANAGVYTNVTDAGGGELNLVLTNAGSIAGVDTLGNFTNLDITASNGEVIVGTGSLDSGTLTVVTDSASDAFVATMAQANAAHDLSGITVDAGGGTFDLRLTGSAGDDYTGMVAANIADVNRILLDQDNGDYVVDTTSVTGLTLAIGTDSTSDRLVVEMDDDEAAAVLDNLSISDLGTGAGKLALYLTRNNDGSYEDVGALTPADLANFDQILLDDSGATADTDGAASFSRVQLTGLTLEFVTDAAGDAITVIDVAGSFSNYSGLSETGAGSLILQTSNTGSYAGLTGLSGFATVDVTTALDAAVTFDGADLSGNTLVFNTDNGADVVSVSLTSAAFSGGANDFTGITHNAGGGELNLEVMNANVDFSAGLDGMENFDEVQLDNADGYYIFDDGDVDGVTVSFATDAAGDVIYIRGDAGGSEDYTNVSETGAGSLVLLPNAAGDLTGITNIDAFDKVSFLSFNGTLTFSYAGLDGATGLVMETDSASDIVSVTGAQGDIAASDLSNVTKTGLGKTTFTATDGGTFGTLNSNIDLFDEITTSSTANNFTLDNTKTYVVNIAGTADHIIDLVADAGGTTDSTTINVTGAAANQTLTFSNFTDKNANATDFDVLDLSSFDFGGSGINAFANAPTFNVDANLSGGGNIDAVFDTIAKQLVIDLNGDGSYNAADDLTIDMAGVTSLTLGDDVLI